MTLVRHARKQHTCDFCALPIPAGRAYENVRVTPWDHPENEGYSTVKAHLRCWEMWEETSEPYGFFPDCPGEWLREMHDRDVMRMEEMMPGIAVPCACTGRMWPNRWSLLVVGP